MAYIIEGTNCHLIFCANVRTGSTATANALRKMGAQETGPGHHGQPRHIPPGSIVFQTVRCPFEVLTSLWFKGRPYGCFECFVFAACRGEYEWVTIPMYNRLAITHNVKYNRLESEFRKLCKMAGVEPEPFKRTPSRTVWRADHMFSKYLRQPVIVTFGEEMKRLGI